MCENRLMQQSQCGVHNLPAFSVSYSESKFTESNGH